jgi:hypothetical protein
VAPHTRQACWRRSLPNRIRTDKLQRLFFSPERAIEIQLGNISQIIQLAIAPVFLLTGVGTNLAVLTNRLGRIIDRARVLETRYSRISEPEQRQSEAELRNLLKRSRLINRAITLSTSSGLLVCLVIATLFVGDAFNIDLAKPIGAMFVLAMVALICSFTYFLREIFFATRTLTAHWPLSPPK